MVGEVALGEHKFWNEYQVDMSDVPLSVAVIPFLANVLPIAWLYGAEIHVTEVDEDFLNSVEDIREGKFDRGIRVGEGVTRPPDEARPT